MRAVIGRLLDNQGKKLIKDVIVIIAMSTKPPTATAADPTETGSQLADFRKSPGERISRSMEILSSRCFV